MHEYNDKPLKDIAASRLWAALLCATGALIMSPALCFGVELCDSGFYATFYDNIFTHPDMVGYNFMYWLSGVAGGVVSYLSGGSLVWLRVAGLLTQLGCILCVWHMFGGRENRHDCRLATLLGVATVCTGILETPLSLYNDNLTALLACASLAMLSAAATGIRSAAALTLAAGAVAGLNTLTRIPNVLEYGFLLLIPLAGARGRDMWRRIGLWTAGWAAGLGGGIVLAAALGHLGLLGETLRDLFATASTSADESTHGIRNLIAVQADAWKRIVTLTAKLCATGGLAWYFARMTPRVWLKTLIWLMAAAPCAKWMTDAGTVTSLAAVALNGCIGNIFLVKDKTLRTASIAGLLMMTILPLGSDNAIYNAGTPVLWIAATAGFAFARIKAGKYVATATALIIIASGALTAMRGGFYFDPTPPAEMTASIKAESAKGLLTSAERAERLDALLAELEKHVEEGDTLMVYGSAPMLNHLTRTLPAAGCSWPELMAPPILESKLSRCAPPQKIMMMKFNTLGAKWSEPSADYLNGVGEFANRFHNSRKSQIILKYIEKKRYVKLTETADFALYERPRS